MPVADPARLQQLRRVAAGSSLIVLTEGSTGSRALAAGMSVTQPHLTGFVNIVDSVALPAEGGVAALARMVCSFAAAGVANDAEPVLADVNRKAAALEMYFGRDARGLRVTTAAHAWAGRQGAC